MCVSYTLRTNRDAMLHVVLRQARIYIYRYIEIEIEIDR